MPPLLLKLLFQAHWNTQGKLIRFLLEQTSSEYKIKCAHKGSQMDHSSMLVTRLLHIQPLNHYSTFLTVQNNVMKPKSVRNHHQPSNAQQIFACALLHCFQIQYFQFLTRFIGEYATARSLAHSLSHARVLHIFQTTSFNVVKYCYVGFSVNEKNNNHFSVQWISKCATHEHRRQVTSVCGKIQHHQDQSKKRINKILTLFHDALRLRTLYAFVRCSSKACTVNGNPRIWVAY